VILDWVPAHFPRDAHGLARFDGTHLYEHADPRRESSGNGERSSSTTDAGKWRTSSCRTPLLDGQYHIDGLRVDAVASMLYLDYSRKPGEWIPNVHGGNENLEGDRLSQRMNELVHERHPGAITVAEESTAWPAVSRPTYLGGLGFTLKWNMGWMHDMLSFIEKDPIHRKYHFGQLTFALLYAFHENFVLPFSHDEVVHLKRSMLDKMPGDLWGKFANLRLLYAYMYATPERSSCSWGGVRPVEEWDHDRPLSWELLKWDTHQGVQRFVRDLNRIYRDVGALHEIDFRPEGFEWIDFRDVDNSVVSFLRRGKDPDDAVVCVFNFTPTRGRSTGSASPGPGDTARR